jgi:DNA-binding transcriptional ArsR family regulator
MDAEAALRALAHPKRRAMLDLVWEVERSSSDLAAECGLSRPATSQHLKVLREADLVSARVDRTHRLYRARTERVAELQAFLDSFWGSKLAALERATRRPARRSR